MTQNANDFVEVYVDDEDQHRWRYRAIENNDEMAGPQQGYSNKAEMMSAIARVTNRVPVIVETKDAPLPSPGTIRIVRGSR